jgi:hypothetical protein
VDERSSQNLPGVIRELQVEIGRVGERPRGYLHEVARRRIDAPQEILDWAKRDRRWSFTLAEVMTEPVSRPRELAARLVLAIVDELEQEREVLAAETDALDAPSR